MALPIALIAAVITQVLCQLYKVVVYSARDGVFSFRYFFTSGGMPSAHSAFVTALATSIALTDGIDSPVFAATAVFGFIVMYDAYRLRGTVEKLTIIIRRLLEERRKGDQRPDQQAIDDDIVLPKMLGQVNVFTWLSNRPCDVAALAKARLGIVCVGTEANQRSHTA